MMVATIKLLFKLSTYLDQEKERNKDCELKEDTQRHPKKCNEANHVQYI